MLKRIGLIGDVHGESAILAAVLRFLRAVPQLDALLCTGDIAGKTGIGDSDVCARLLIDAGVVTVRGNHDRWALSKESDVALLYSGTDIYREFAGALPPYQEFEVPYGPGLLCHGVGANDMDGIYPGGEDEPLIYVLKSRRIYGHDRVMICGHTHKRLVRPLGTLTVINAGTLRRDNDPCFSVIDFEAGDVQFYDIAPDTLTITTADAFRLMETINA